MVVDGKDILNFRIPIILQVVLCLRSSIRTVLHWRALDRRITVGKAANLHAEGCKFESRKVLQKIGTQQLLLQSDWCLLQCS
jgi:hypothetical protein